MTGEFEGALPVGREDCMQNKPPGKAREGAIGLQGIYLGYDRGVFGRSFLSILTNNSFTVLHLYR